jgi:hypothetical protein
MIRDVAQVFILVSWLCIGNFAALQHNLKQESSQNSAKTDVFLVTNDFRPDNQKKGPAHRRRAGPSLGRKRQSHGRRRQTPRPAGDDPRKASCLSIENNIDLQ